MLRILAKELRENWALFVSVLVAGQGLLFVLNGLGIVGGIREDWMVCQFLVVMLSACLGGSLVGQEAERGTLELIWTRPGPRWHLWAAKLLFGLPASILLGASFAWTVGRLGGTVPIWLPPSSVWPWEAALSFLAGFTMSGVTRAALVSAMVGLQLFGLIALSLLVSPLRLTIFWPVAVLSLAVASFYTTRAAIAGSFSSRARALGLGLVVGFLLFPAVFGTLWLLPKGKVPAQAVWLNEYKNVPGRPGVMVAAMSVPVHPLEPLRHRVMHPWDEPAERRLMSLDVQSGRRQWLAPRWVGRWSLSLDGRWAITDFDDNDRWDSTEPAEATSLDAPAQLIRLGEGDEVRDASYDPIFTVLSRPTEEGSWLLRRLNIFEVYGARMLACGQKAGLIPEKVGYREVFSNRTPHAWTFAGRALVVEFSANGDGWNKTLNRWSLDLGTGEARPVLPRGASGASFPGARFLQGLNQAAGRWELFVTGEGRPGVCLNDGAQARLLDGGVGPAPGWLDPAPGSLRWSDDGKHAVVLIGHGTLNTGDEAWHVDAEKGRVARIVLPRRENGEWSESTLVPVAGGAFIAASTGRGDYPQRLRQRELVWCPAGPGGKPEVLRHTTDLMHEPYCQIHGTGHPIWIEVSSTGHAWKWPYDVDYRGSCAQPFAEIPFGDARWTLVAMRPAAEGGPAALELLATKTAYAPFLAVSGKRAVVRQRNNRLQLADWSSPEARLIPLPVGDFEAGETFASVEWLDDRQFLQSNERGLWLLDAVNLTRRRLI